MSKKKRPKGRPGQSQQTKATVAKPHSPSGKIYFHIDGDKGTSELESLNPHAAVKLAIWHTSAKEALDSTLSTFLQPDQYILLEKGSVDVEENSLLGNALHAFLHPSMATDQFSVAHDFEKEKEVSTDQSYILTDSSSKIRDFAYKSLGVSGVTHTPTGHIYYSWSDIQQILVSGFPKDKWHELYTARWLKEIEVEERTEIATARGGLGKTLTLNPLYAGKYFLSEPLRSIRQSKSLVSDLGDGNHPAYRLLVAATLVILLFLMPILSFDYGITWDEPEHVSYADDINAYITTFGADSAVFDKTKRVRQAMWYYGPSVDIATSAIYKTFPSFGVYETRHFFNALCGLLGMIFTARLAKELGSWRTAWLAVLFLTFSPRYFGHSMNNHKDIPFLAAYVMGLFYLVRMIKQLPYPRPGTIFWLTVSVGAILNVKVGGLLIVGYIGLFGATAWLVQGARLGYSKVLDRIPWYALYLVIVVGIGFVLGIMFWPPAYADPIGHTQESLGKFTKFTLLHIYELFRGERLYMVTDTPKTYIPIWIGVTIPLFVIIGFLAGLVPWKKSRSEYPFAIHLMLLFTIFFPTIYIIAKASTLYSGWRHVLFVYAPMVAISVSGWEFLIGQFKAKTVKYVIVGLLTLLILKPAYWMVKNHPNQYIYFNELVGGINGAYTRYETEYWGNINKQAVDWLLENEPIDASRKFRVATNFAPVPLQYYLDKDTTKKIETVWCRENEKYKKKWDYAFFGTRTMSPEHIKNAFPPKGTIHVIKADSVPLVAIVRRPKQSAFLEAYQAVNDNNYELAIVKCNEAITYDPLNVEYYRLLARLYVNKAATSREFNPEEREAMYKRAIGVAKKAIKINPEDFPAYTSIGLAYSRMGQEKQDVGMVKKAIQYFELSTKYKINNVGGHQNKGKALAALGQFDAAISAYQEASRYDQGRNPLILYDAAQAMIGKAKTMGSQFQENSKLQLLNDALTNLYNVLGKRPEVYDCYRLIAEAYQVAGDEKKANEAIAKYRQSLQGK